MTSFFASIPEEWRTSPLKLVTEFLGRGSAPDYADDGPVHVVNQAVNRGSHLDWSKGKFHGTSSNPKALKGFLKKSDVIINSTGTGTLGRVGFFDGSPDDRPAIADGHVTIVRARENELLERYAYYVLSSSQFYDFMYSSMVVGSTNQIELSRERLGSTVIPLPSLGEQRRIADFLDAQVGHIDSLVSSKERASNLIDERRVALTSQRCLRGTHKGVDTKDSGIGPLGQTPSHWSIVRNKNIIREVNEPSVDGSEELLTVSHLTGVTPRSEKNVYMFMAESMVGYKKCRPGDLAINTLWAWMGALGFSKFNGIVSPAYGVYRFTSDDLLTDYFDLLYRTPEYICEMTRHSKGVWSSRLRLYPESFLALSVPVPPLEEQENIIRTLEEELEPERRLQQKIHRSNSLLLERRQALITAAVTGQIDVTTARGADLS
ncbi:restriction endonuclease subunit S [Nocardiopsis nanhaiensis]